MRRRCYDKNFVGYKNYGGRGITVCERWLEFQNFYDDMHESFDEHVEKFGEKDTTLDRIDVNGNYCAQTTNTVNATGWAEVTGSPLQIRSDRAR